MSYFEVWNQRIEDSTDQEKYKNYVQHYYELEKEAYSRILSAYPNNMQLISGKAVELARLLGFAADDMDVFVGFVDGINASLETEQDLAAITDDTVLDLKINYEKLFWHMHDAKAEWLYTLPAWEQILTKEKQAEIIKDYRTSKIVHKDKIGRNDPCPCGSGKKYKQCCLNKE